MGNSSGDRDPALRDGILPLSRLQPCFPQPSGDIRHSQHILASRKVGIWYIRTSCARLVLPMLYKTLSAAVYGIDANIIQVEVDCSGIKCDQDHFHTVGLPDAAVRESRDRVRAALKNCGYDIPPTHITINLAPADIKKEGSGFDLPMALGIVGAYGGLTKKEMTDCLFVGELSLDGGVRASARSSPDRDRGARQEDYPHGRS